MKAVFLCGGLGRRMFTLSGDKFRLDFLGKTLLEHQLELARGAGSSLTRMSDRVLHLNCRPEIGVAATKTFISQLAVCYLLAFTMGNGLEEGIRQIRAIPPLIEANFQENRERLSGIARRLKDRVDFYYIACGINFAVAGEEALKLKEVACVHAEGMPLPAS